MGRHGGTRNGAGGILSPSTESAMFCCNCTAQAPCCHFLEPGMCRTWTSFLGMKWKWKPWRLAPTLTLQQGEGYHMFHAIIHVVIIGRATLPAAKIQIRLMSCRWPPIDVLHFPICATCPTAASNVVGSSSDLRPCQH